MGNRSELGITGLAVMGRNLARNVARHGIPVAVHNRTAARTRELIERYGDEGPFTAATSIEELVDALERPRRILIMVKAGAAVDAVIDQLVPHLEPGDVLIDGGNSHFEDTRRRERALRERELRFIGTGISGGEEGALHGPSIMPGGAPEAYAAVEHVLTAVAAKVDGTPCCTHVGPDGAGHYVKMVHNGIEYADMQLITEAYDLLRQALRLDAGQLAEIFGRWNQGDLESFLIETTAQVLGQVDAVTGQPLVDVILDEAEQKGTGRWTAQSALELGVPITGITEAVFARMLSARKRERTAAASVLAGPGGAAHHLGDGFVDDVRDALYASKVVAYAQGFDQIATASEHFGWGIDLGAMATIWRGGCIIRARFLQRIREACEQDPALRNLLMAEYFRDAVAAAQGAWRRVVTAAVDLGVPVPAFASSLAYYDGLRRARSPANLLQGLRDFFGAHTYHRIDRPGTFHTRWAQDGQEVEIKS
ncbi:MAG TPA: NADP-dependent phosphogluconate dehydrogenase [Actinomycetes bacterium]|jgi:6-phosphogluconate dehydrogenase|nr:NADP-dependent phosphogluconate dehydrogenase [Actinomycetes bacterium]